MPFTKNQIITLEIEALSNDGNGVAHKDGQAVFVPLTAPGDVAEVRIVKPMKTYAFGRVEKLLEKSPSRAEPFCPIYKRCGGCVCQHMTYEASLAFKRQQVQDLLQRVGGLSIEVPPVWGMAHPFGYRNKGAYPVAQTGGAPACGFFAPRSHDIIPIAQCPNAMPPADEICRRVLGWMKRFHVEPYVEETHTGLVRHIVVRVNRKGEAMAVLVINGGEITHEGAVSYTHLTLPTILLV